MSPLNCTKACVEDYKDLCEVLNQERIVSPFVLKNSLISQEEKDFELDFLFKNHRFSHIVPEASSILEQLCSKVRSIALPYLVDTYEKRAPIPEPHPETLVLWKQFVELVGLDMARGALRCVFWQGNFEGMGKKSTSYNMIYTVPRIADPVVVFIEACKNTQNIEDAAHFGHLANIMSFEHWQVLDEISLRFLESYRSEEDPWLKLQWIKYAAYFSNGKSRCDVERVVADLVYDDIVGVDMEEMEKHLDEDEGFIDPKMHEHFFPREKIEALKEDPVNAFYFELTEFINHLRPKNSRSEILKISVPPREMIVFSKKRKIS